MFFCYKLSEMMQSLDITLVLMGQQGDFSKAMLSTMTSRGVHIVDREEEQARVGIFLRAAADFSFVPSFFEAFGLVAAEGLLFGCTVLSTGVGGLQDFLIDRKEPKDGFFNAFLFSVHDKGTFAEAARDAVNFLNSLDSEAKERHMGAMVEKGLSMAWQTPKGPLDQYFAVYNRALRKRAQFKQLPQRLK